METVDRPPDAPTPTDDGWEEVVEVYQAETRPAQGYRTRASLHRSRGMGKVLAGLLRKEGKDRLLLVLRWIATSPHDRAAWLRDGQYGPETIRRKFDEYADLAASGSAGRRPRSPMADHHPGAVPDDLGHAVDPEVATAHGLVPCRCSGGCSLCLDTTGLPGWTRPKAEA